MSDPVNRVFVDTNLLLYSVDESEKAKHVKSREWLDALWTTDSGRVSWQVLNEFYANATRKLKLPSVRARENVETFAMWRPVGFGLGLLHRAWYWGDKAGIPYWDCLIVASAETIGCRYLLSEDFQDGQKFGDVTVVNPFVSSPKEFGFE